nr:hypothetical protein [Tanacetum cinerariifolium]
ASISLPPEIEVERLLAMPTPPPSPLTSLSPPSAWERLARDDIPKTELLPRKKSCLFTLGPMYEVGESSTARPTEGRGIDYGFVSTLDAKVRRRRIREVRYGIRNTWVDLAKAIPEIAPMTLGEAQHHVHKTRSQMQQTEMAELRETDRRRQAQMVEILRVIGDMRQEMGDMHVELLALRIMAPVTRRGSNTPPNNISPKNMTPESVQAMIDQALLQNSTNRDGSHSSDVDNRRNVQTARPCFYADIMQCHPLCDLR